MQLEQVQVARGHTRKDRQARRKARQKRDDGTCSCTALGVAAAVGGKYHLCHSRTLRGLRHSADRVEAGLEEAGIQERERDRLRRWERLRSGPGSADPGEGQAPGIAGMQRGHREWEEASHVLLVLQVEADTGWPGVDAPLLLHQEGVGRRIPLEADQSGIHSDLTW